MLDNVEDNINLLQDIYTSTHIAGSVAVGSSLNNWTYAEVVPTPLRMHPIYSKVTHIWIGKLNQYKSYDKVKFPLNCKSGCQLLLCPFLHFSDSKHNFWKWIIEENIEETQNHCLRIIANDNGFTLREGG